MRRLTGKELVELRDKANDNNADIFFGTEEQEMINQYHKAEDDAKENQKKLFASYYKFRSVYDLDQVELMELMSDGCVIACCSQECEVEPDGYCEHGHPSILLANHMI